MHEVLIDNHNKVVGKDDHIWYLGDISFGNVAETRSILDRLNGIKHLIVGNHDRKGRADKLFNRDWQEYFVDSHDYYRLNVDGMRFVLCHFPFASWERGYINLHGHLHTTKDKPKGKWRQHDVGVDLNNYTPLLAQDAYRLATEGKEPEILY
jgi:calcineurin-like phosphoesterase family protein